MAAQGNANVVAVELEKVRSKLTLLYERDDILLTMIQQKGDLEKVSNRAMRIPLQMFSGGRGGAYNADGGDMGRGGGTDYEVASISPLPFKFSVEITKLVEYGTDSKEKAVANAAKREVAESMKQFRAFLDKITNSSAGDGVIGTITSVAANVYTMTIPTGAVGVYVGQNVSVYSANLVTNRGAFNVLNVDTVSATQTITGDATPAGTIATDVLVYEGLTGANPVGIFGLKYHQSAATTGTWQNLNRATFAPFLTTPSVNASSAALTPGFVRLAINKIRKALGTKQSSQKLIAYMNVDQEHSWENLGITISQIIKQDSGGGANDLDLLFTGKKTMSGVPITSSINADQTRVDFLDLSHWGRSVLKDIDFFEVDGKTVFPLYNATSGAPAAAYWFAYDTVFNIFNDSPRSGSFISSLSRPAGY